MKTPKDYIIFPLDVPSPDAAERLVDLLTGHVGTFKVGLELFVRSGPALIERILKRPGSSVFLDLKFHDIPETVFRAVSGIVDLGVAFATVHCGETPRMLEAAARAGRGKVKLLGVTVLTSVSEKDLSNCGFSGANIADPTNLVMHRTAMAHAAGFDGVVCSGLEAAQVKKKFGPQFLAVTPGIRPFDKKAETDDQQRVTTPARAIAAGADYLVIGRPIRDAKNPPAAADAVAVEIDAALRKKKEDQKIRS